MTLTPPPPWTDLGNLLRLGIYMYVGLLALALANATIRHCSLRSPNASAAFSNASSKRLSAHCYRETLGNYSFHISVFRLLFASFACITYVYITDIGFITPYLSYTLRTIGAILFAYVISVVATSDRPISVVANVLSVVEVISLSSTLFAKQTDWLNFSFLQAYGIM